MKVGGRASVGLATLALTLALALSACGSGGDSGGANGGRGGSRDDAAQRGSKDPQEAMLAFARCMREQGVDIPDPVPGGTAVEVDPGGADAPFRDDFREAEKTCRKHLANVKPPELSEEDEGELREAALAHARCMREHGIDMPDPQVDGGGVRIEPGSIDPQDPEFRKAQKECEKHLRGALGPPSAAR